MSVHQEVVDREGRWIIVPSETCAACGKDSRATHPAGVVPSRWRCSCGYRQSDRLQVDSE